MLSLYRYNMAYTFRKVSTWVILGIMAVISFSIIISIGYEAASSASFFGNERQNTLLGANPYIIFILLILIIMSISYVSLKAANIFKDGETDGTTLLIVSKPFTRKEVVFSKIFSAITHTFFPVLVFFVSFTIGDMIYDFKFMGTNIKYILSYSLGILVINIIFMSISLLLASVLGKVGTLLLTMISFIVIWVVGMCLPLISKAGVPASNSHYVYNNAKKTFEEGTSRFGYQENENDKYKTLSLFDIWYQISGPFELMSKTPAREKIINMKVRKNQELADLYKNSIIKIPKHKSEHEIEVDEEKFRINVKNNGWNMGATGWTSSDVINSISNDKKIDANIKNAMGRLNEYFKNDIKTLSDLNVNFYRTNSKSASTSYAALYVWFREHYKGEVLKIEVVKNLDVFKLYGTSDGKREAITNEMVIDNYGANLLEAFKSLSKITTLDIWKHITELNDLNIPFIKKVYKDDDVHGGHKADFYDSFAYQGKIVPYINPWVRSSIWVVISLIMISGVTLVYMRRDFK